MNSPLSIEFNRGLGVVSFGSIPAVVEKAFGPPDETSCRGGAETLDMGWFYTKLKLDVFFHTGQLVTDTWHQGDPLRVILFTTSSRKALLWDKPIVGLPESSLLALFATKGEPTFEVLQNSGYPDHERPEVRILRFRSLNADLHFRGGLLRQVQWGVEWLESPASFAFPPKCKVK